MPDNTLKSFPSNEAEALAMLWLQNQDLSNATSESLFDKYQDAYDKIKERKKQECQAKHESSGWTF